MFFEIKGKNSSKMAIKYKIKLRDLKLEHLKEYIAPIFNFLKPKKKITNISELKNFIQRKSAWVSQETLYGYLKTRMGAKYILMFEDEIFLGSINKAKWNIFAVALQDLTFYCLSYLKNNSNTDYTLNAIEIYKEILNEEKNNADEIITPDNNSIISSTCNTRDNFLIEDLGIVLTADEVTGDKNSPVADPSAIITKEGRIRLYFLGGAFLGIMSAISEDGINFEIEESRLQSKNTSFKVLGAPRVIRDNNGSIKLFAKAGEKASDGIAAFISYDDEFTCQEEKMVANHQELGLEKASKFTPIKIDEHKYQSYVADGATTDPKSLGERKIKTLYSDNLDEWELYDVPLVGSGSDYITDPSREPFPLKRLAQCITLFYVHGGHGIYYSTSEDGITFKTEYDLGLGHLYAAGPWVLYQAEKNRYLLYYDATSEENGHHIRVAEIKMLQQ